MRNRVIFISLFLLISTFCFGQNNLKAVDMGLSVKWASCDLGAKSMLDCGDYYFWGNSKKFDEAHNSYCAFQIVWSDTTEVSKKKKILVGIAAGTVQLLNDLNGDSEDEGSKTKTEVFFNSLNSIDKGIQAANELQPKINTYYSYTRYTQDDGRKSLSRGDDAASCTLGGRWRMPTREECEELIDNCDWAYFEKDGVKKVVFVAPNGNSITIPLDSDGKACLWTSSLDDEDYYEAYYFNITKRKVSVKSEERRNLLRVRPVYK